MKYRYPTTINWIEKGNVGPIKFSEEKKKKLVSKMRFKIESSRISKKQICGRRSRRWN